MALNTLVHICPAASSPLSAFDRTNSTAFPTEHDLSFTIRAKPLNQHCLLKSMLYVHRWAFNATKQSQYKSNLSKNNNSGGLMLYADAASNTYDDLIKSSMCKICPLVKVSTQANKQPFFPALSESRPSLCRTHVY